MRWRRLQAPVVLFGAVVVALSWGGFLYQVGAERDQVTAMAIERGDVAARLFENDLVRLLKSIDTVMLVLRRAYEDDPEHFDLAQEAHKAGVGTDVMTELGLVRADGWLITRSTGPLPAPIYIGDRLHFRLQVDPPDDALYIGETVTLRATGQVVIQISRRLRTPTGAFAGIIGGQIDPGFVEQFSRTLRLGPDSNISVRGVDGMLRAAYGFKAPPVQQTKVLTDALAQAPSGYFWGGGVSDGIPRLVTYRTIVPYGLVITIGEPEAHIFVNAEHRRVIYLGLASAVTLLTVCFVGLTVYRQRRLTTLIGQFDAAITNMPQGLAMFDHNARLIAFNSQWADIYDLSAARVGMSFDEVLRDGPLAGLPECDVVDAMHHTKAAVASGKRVSLTFDLKNGRTIGVTVAPRPEGGWVSVHEDITDRKIIERRTQRLAHFDALTGLANRHLFKEQVEETLARQLRSGLCFAVLVIDLDKFKAVNDTLGHQAGDALLTVAAARIASALRDGDQSARLGGDEFAVILQPCNGDPRVGAAAAAERLIETVKAPYDIDGRRVVIGCSIGIALVPEHGNRLDDLLRNADLALYRSKQSGRNCFHFYSEQMKAERRYTLEPNLREAI